MYLGCILAASEYPCDYNQIVTFKCFIEIISTTMKQRIRKRNLRSIVKTEICPEVEYNSFSNCTIKEKKLIAECFAAPFFQNK